jgi:hypothetical protein
MKLQVELNQNSRAVVAAHSQSVSDSIMITPPIDEGFWLARVKVSDKQAIVCFPKFLTIGCGFQFEDDWNTNLPLAGEAKDIFRHIKHNKGDDTIPDSRCIEAIELLQAECKKMSLI